MKVNILDLFSGIGGFHLGLKQSGFIFDWVGFSEIDKYASKQYKRRFPNAAELGDITTIQCEDLPKNIDILCGGFPCQAFSIAGKRKGFDDTRGTLFFEIARILRYFRGTEQPIPYFILENVKGLLNHEDGRTFATIYRVLTDLDYSVECELLNTRNFSCPQNRERIYIVGRFRGKSRSKIFPIGKPSEIPNNRKSEEQIAATLQSPGHACGNYKGMNMIADRLKQIGNIDQKGHNSLWGRVYDTGGISSTLNAKGGGMGAKTGLYQVKPVLTPNRPEKRQNGRRFKEDGEDMFTLTSQDQHGVMLEKKINIVGNLKGEGGHECHNVHSADGISPTVRQNHGKITMIEEPKEPIEKSSIRRLTPVECERLQGFPDGWTEGQSDTQRYKQLGNAVSVPVVKAIGDKLITLL